MRVEPPSTITLEGKVYALAGKGRAPGSKSYFCHLTGRTVEAYLAQVRTTGPLFAMVQVAENLAMPAVKVPASLLRQPVTPGSILLVGPVDFGNGQPIARGAWVLGGVRPPSPIASRSYGIVRHIDELSRFGWIHEEGSRESVFVHRSQCVGCQLMPGIRVSYRRSHNERGPCALDVRLA